MTLEDCRQFYADEIRLAANIVTPGLADAFARVPREKFLGSPPWHIGGARPPGPHNNGYKTSDARDLYHNVLVALDLSRGLNNGQPSALAAWIDALALESGNAVFHLGCGVGYYTAIMAEVVGNHGRVFAAEVDPHLAARAQQNLASYPNVSVHSGDGVAFNPGICDAILVNAGVTHPHLPWLAQLTANGRLILPLTTAASGGGVMVKIVREGNRFSAHMISAVAIYNCSALRDASLEAKLDKVFASREILNLKSLRTDTHVQDATCLVHARDFCLSAAAVDTLPEPTSTTV